MNRKSKIAIAAVTVLALAGGGGTFALAGSSAPQAVPAPTSVPTSEAPAEVLSEQIEQIAPEVVGDAKAPTDAAAIGSEQIRSAQEKLLSIGFWLPSVDGKVGSVTSQSVMAFQKVNGLERTGRLDAKTASAIEGASRPAPGSTGADHIEIDKKRQVIFVVRGGAVQWVFNTSTGTERSYVTNGRKGFAHTPTGTFGVNRVINGVDKGPLGDLYKPRYFTNNGIAVHGSASIPAYGASHGCARVHNAVMDFIWANNLMPMGSKVWVYDTPSSPAFGGAGSNPPVTAAPTTAAPITTVAPTTAAPVTTVPPTTTTVPPTTAVVTPDASQVTAPV